MHTKTLSASLSLFIAVLLISWSVDPTLLDNVAKLVLVTHLCKVGELTRGRLKKDNRIEALDNAHSFP